MDNEFIVSRMQSYIHRDTQELSAWLCNFLPRISDNWWNECVLDKFNNVQRELVRDKQITSLEKLDLALLLRIADKAWFGLYYVAMLSTKDRECVH